MALLPLGLGHFLNAGIETIFYQTYMQDTVIWGMTMGLFAFLMFIGLATKYAKKEVNLHMLDANSVKKLFDIQVAFSKLIQMCGLCRREIHA